MSRTAWRFRFIAPDDGTAAGEPTECSNPVAVVMTAEALLRKEGHVGAVAFSRTDGRPLQGGQLEKLTGKEASDGSISPHRNFEKSANSI
jgi:hypothetical protein